MFKFCFLAMACVCSYAQTITVAPTTVAVGGVVTVTVVGGPGDTNSWIGEYAASKIGPALYLDWLYISGTKLPASTALTGATVKFTMAAAGLFQFAFHANDSYSPIANSGVVQVSAAITPITVSAGALTCTFTPATKSFATSCVGGGGTATSFVALPLVGGTADTYVFNGHGITWSLIPSSDAKSVVFEAVADCTPACTSTKTATFNNGF